MSLLSRRCPGSLGESDSFLEQYAKAEGTYRSARALVYETWDDIRQSLDAGSRLSVRQHTMMRLAMAHVERTRHAAIALDQRLVV